MVRSFASLCFLSLKVLGLWLTAFRQSVWLRALTIACLLKVLDFAFTRVMSKRSSKDCKTFAHGLVSKYFFFSGAAPLPCFQRP